MGAGDRRQLVGFEVANEVEGELGLGCGFVRKALGEDQLLARLRTEVVLGGRHFVETIGITRREGDGAVARDGPGRGRPDYDKAAGKAVRTFGDRELHPDHVAFDIGIFDFGFGKRGALDDRPHDRLGAAVELAELGDLHQFASDARFRMEVHRRVGIVEVALDAEALELLGLDLDPAGGEVTALLAEFVDRDLVLVLALLAVLLFDLPLDRQTMAVPAGHIVGVEAAHLERAIDDVLEDLVQRMADVDVAVRIGRAVMQHKLVAAGGRCAQLLVEAHLLPAGHRFRLLLRQAGAHREFRLRQIKGRGVVDLFSGVGHGLCNRFFARGAAHTKWARYREMTGASETPKSRTFRLTKARGRPGQ
ncbi:hypothetical protein D9M68_346810 [compost metagenome]